MAFYATITDRALRLLLVTVLLHRYSPNVNHPFHRFVLFLFDLFCVGSICFGQIFHFLVFIFFVCSSFTCDTFSGLSCISLGTVFTA